MTPGAVLAGIIKALALGPPGRRAAALSPGPGKDRGYVCCIRAACGRSA
jgi:hypothetical protein